MSFLSRLRIGQRLVRIRDGERLQATDRGIRRFNAVGVHEAACSQHREKEEQARESACSSKSEHGTKRTISCAAET